MKNIKKNTGANPHISMHTEIMFGRITQKINEIGRKTYALKKKENAFYAEAQKNHAIQNWLEQTSCEKYHTINLNRNGKKLRKEKMR